MYKTILLLILVSFLKVNIIYSQEKVFYYYKNGTIASEGYLINKKPEGYWINYYEKGIKKSEGNRVDFLLEGEWIFYNNKGEIENIFLYKKGLKEGVQKSFINGNIYKEENYFKDKKEGNTIIYYINKTKEEIPFVEGKKEGDGYLYGEEGFIITIIKYKSGVKIKEEKINRKNKEGLKEGYWVVFYNNKEKKEEGFYLEDKKEGYYKYYKEDGSIEKIEKYKKGILDEKDKEAAKIKIKKTFYRDAKIKSKTTYINEIKDGVYREYNKEGEVKKGKIFELGKIISEGILDDEGKKQGDWVVFYKNGKKKEEGKYKNNKKEGGWVFYYNDEKKEHEGNFIKGLAEGEWIWYYPSGNILRKETFVNGLKEGESVEYTDSTKHLLAKGNYIEGQKEGAWEYSVNDHKEKGTYKEGLKDGNWRAYYKNDVLKFEGKFIEGLPEGKHTHYYNNKKIKEKGFFVGGEKHGKWIKNNKEGVLFLEIEYNNGQEIKYNGVTILDKKE